MSTTAKQIDFLLAGLSDESGVPLSGAIVVTRNSANSAAKAVWEDKDKTLPSAAGKSQFNLDADGRAEVFADGIYTILIYDAADTLLTSPIYTFEGLAYSTFDGSQVNSMFDLIGLTVQTEGDTVGVIGYFVTFPSAEFFGGGTFVWQEDLNKNTADGGKVIDPDNIGGFDGTVSTRDAFLAVQGTGVGSGCWVRIPEGKARVKNYGAIGNGIVEDTAACLVPFTQLEPAIHFDAGTYYCPKASGSILTTGAEVNITGDGLGVSIVQAEGTAGTVNLLNISNNLVSVEDVTFSALSSAAVPILIAMQTDSIGFSISRVELEGLDTWDAVDTNFAHGIKLNSSSSVTKVSITDCLIHDLGFGVFTANDFVGVTGEWTFTGNHFWNNTTDDIVFNSDNRATENWHNLTVTGNTFKEHPSATPNSVGVGTDSGQEIVITDNTFDGYVSAGIHIEDEIKDVVVANNVFEDCWHGVEIYVDKNSYVSVTDNVFNGGAGFGEDVDASTLPDPVTPLLDNSIGIVIQRPLTTGNNRNSIISGNIISNYAVGMSCPQGFDNTIFGNTVASTSLAYAFAVPGQYAFKDNTATHCKFVFQQLGPSGVVSIDSVIIDQCPTLFFGIPVDFHVMRGFTIKKISPALTTGVTTEVELLEFPTRVWGDQCSVLALRQDSLTQAATAVGELTYEGTTLTATRNMTYETASVVVADPMFTATGGKLNTRIFHAVGSDTIFEITAYLPTMFIFN